MSTDREFSVDSVKHAFDALEAMEARPLDVSNLAILPGWAVCWPPPSHTEVDEDASAAAGRELLGRRRGW